MMIRGHVIKSVLFRNLASYFSGLLGYVVIVAFVVIAASLAFSAEFFANNHATLDQLTQNFPALLVFLIPALTMTTWADEKKLGTDELLFTLPATDFEILIGKYKAVKLVFLIALLFSCTNLILLAMIGNPDWGVQFTTYIGYFLAGAALIGAGMLASALTSNAAVAFVLGAIFCAIPIYISVVVNTIASGFAALLRTFGMAPETANQYIPDVTALESLTVGHHLEDFALGIFPLAGTIYFLALAAFFLYLNYIVISRRHWHTGRENNSMGWQYFVRGVSLGVILISVTSLCIGSIARFDLTEKNLYTLSDTTSKVISELDSKKPVTIQAFVSPDVPEEYNAVQQNLTGMLREFDHMGGSNITVRIIPVKPYSEEAEQARLLGITSRSVQTERNGEISIEDVFLGVRVSSGFDEVVVPFFDLGNSVEYELTRSLRTVSQESRLTVGILTTDAKVMGGFDSSTFRSSPEWQIVSELKKQYEVQEVSPDSPIDGDLYDVLIAILPSSLNQQQLGNFVSYVEAGHPTLIFDDPMPMFQISLAPSQPKPQQGGGMFGQQQQPEPKGDDGKLTSLTSLLEISWDNTQVVFDRDLPYPRLRELLPSPEIVFIYDKTFFNEEENKRIIAEGFNEEDVASQSLQQLLVFNSGTVLPLQSSTVEFTPLLRTGAANSGVLSFNDLVRQNPMFGPTLNPNPRRVKDDFSHVVAARIQTKGGEAGKDTAPGVNAIFVADIDIISDGLFQLAERQLIASLDVEMKLDNIRFVLNSVDSLAGEEDFIQLRNRRDESRTLDWVEELTSTAVEKRSQAEERARKLSEDELEKAQEELDANIAKIQNDQSLDDQSKIRQIRMLENAQNKKLQADTEDIERNAEAEIRSLKDESEREIEAVKGQFRFWSIVLPPLPAILLGLCIGIIRFRSERRGIIDERLVKKGA